MEILKKEWKAILFTLWLIGITIFLNHINTQLNQLVIQNSKMASTLDSVESVAISTDSAVANISKEVDTVGSNVSFIVQKVRRR